MITAGVDECGRGPLAGPVVAAAVILPENCPVIGLADSKVLSASKRQRLEPQIKHHALAWSIAQIEAGEIDRINIFKASLAAMARALNELSIAPEKALIDGQYIPPGLDCPAQAVIKGDSKVAAISAASILAKQFRDRLMNGYDIKYPGYGFGSNKGYPTRAHILALGQLGACPIHRISFGPVASLPAIRKIS